MAPQLAVIPVLMYPGETAFILRFGYYLVAISVYLCSVAFDSPYGGKVSEAGIFAIWACIAASSSSQDSC